MQSKINQNDDYFSGNLEIQNLKLSLLFFENFTVVFQISYLREKKLSGQIVMCFSVSIDKSQCFKEFYDFILAGQSWFKSNGINEGYEEC